MNLTDTKTVKELLNEHDAKPIKHFGQNFLVNEKTLEKIISNTSAGKTVIEIGPGMGTLTKELIKNFQKVIAIEKDKKMTEIMRETLGEKNNLKIIEEDFLKTDLEKIISNRNYSVVSNLPYYIATAIIRKFLEFKNPPEEMILTIQKELAQRICSKPPRMNLLATSVQFYSSPKIIFHIPRNHFWPQPKIDSSLLKISEIQIHEKHFSQDFFKIVKAGFSRPRAQLLNNLSKELKLEKKYIKQKLLSVNINPEQRAETLNISDWTNLTEKIR